MHAAAACAVGAQRNFTDNILLPKQQSQREETQQSNTELRAARHLRMAMRASGPFAVTVTVKVAPFVAVAELIVIAGRARVLPSAFSSCGGVKI